MSKTPISILQELMVSRHKGAPFYNIESASSSTGFGFQCIVCADELTATGYGNTKQSAKQNSAQKLLNALGYSVANYELNVNPVINHHVIITQKPSTPLINYVGKLNEFASGKGKPYPEYSESVVPLNGIFTVNCKFASMKAKGNGTTKKLAKQEAAKAMLALLKDANLSDDIVPILDEKKLNNINRLTNEVIKRMAQNFQISNNKRMDNNHTVESRPSLFSGPKARFESIGKLIEYLENKGHKCNISTIQADPYVMIMEIENTSCSSIKWGMHGVKSPTPIQANCIPKILDGCDCIGAAKTGSGKTLAFALPIIQRLCEDPYGIFALVLTPTRELAYQIADQFAVIGKPINLKHCVIVGGIDMVEQGKQLSKHPHIVVATPGRLADHLESCKTFSLLKIKFLVLDEADRLLSGQFDDQIKTIFSHLPKERQNLFFSATITDTLEKLKTVSKQEVFLYQAPSMSDAATVEELQQHYVLCPKDVKDAYLVEVIREYRSTNEDGNIMIFTDTCKNCQLLSMTLNEVGFENVALHAMIPQQQRLAALARFKSNTVKMLIATDVASRGLDIPTVQLVLNHALPSLPKEYIHRVGRTARAGRSGKAITLITPYDIKKLQLLEDHIKCKLSEFKINDSEVSKIFTQVSVTKSEAYLKLDEDDFYEKILINKRKKWILEGLDPDEEEEKLLKKRSKKRKKEKSNVPITKINI